MSTHARPAGRRARPLGAGALALATGLTLALTTVPAQADDAELLQVDFATTEGAFKGGASGMLYGLSDEGVPTDPIIEGARPLNVTQKAPHGEQHPNGDPLEVEDAFFRNGGEYILTNIQDYYPDWPYNGGRRPADFSTYLAIVERVVTAIRDESDHPEKYMFVPFNEPDGGNWYPNWGAQRETFLNDWKLVYDTIKRVDPDAKIAGLGDTGWQSQRTRDFLTYAQANDVMPDMFTWHELGINNLATFRGHYADYRTIEQDLGIDPLPVNITEYAMRRDMSVPGQLVQWLAMFEDVKVDAQTAYWTYAGNLNDNMAKNNAANGAWWLLKWYGDMSGESVALTPPELDKVDSLQGMATIDAERRQGTVVYGGTAKDVRLELDGIDPEVFGGVVDVQVREAAWSGQEGEAPAPPVVVAERVEVTDGEVEIRVPGGDRLSAYQVVVTPALAQQPSVDDAWRAEVEAEATTLRDVQTYSKPMSNDWEFAASGQRDVGSTNRVTSSLTWTVDVPADGEYVFGAVAGVNGPSIGPGRHALFVDGEFATFIEYEAGFSWGYRGRGEAVVDLEQGSRELSVRMSRDGSTLLPGSDISLDKFDLTSLENADSSHYPAHLARTDGAVAFDGRVNAGSVSVEDGQSVDFFAAVRETGYSDLTVEYRTSAPAQVAIEANGRTVATVEADRAGTWTTTVPVHLAEGITKVSVRAVEGSAAAASLDVVRNAAADAVVFRTEAEDAAHVIRSGQARVEGVSAPTNVSGSQVGWVGDGEANAVVIARPDSFDAGEYNLVVRYANAERNTGHAYNTDVITRFLDVAEVGGEDGHRAAFRHNYSWKGFWSHVVPVDLTTADGGIRLSNATGPGPNLDWFQLAPLSLEVTTEVSDNVDLATLEVVTAPVRTGYLVGDALDLTGLEVAALYTDDTRRTVAVSELEVTGFDPSTPGTQQVHLTLTENGVGVDAVVTVVVRERFVDIAPDNQFATEIDWVAATGISTGWAGPSGPEFRALEPIARDAMAAFLFRLAGSPEVDLPATSPFVDVTPDNVFYREIVWLSQERISTGWAVPGGHEFRPLEPIARDAMAAFLHRMAGSPAYEAPQTAHFTDLAPGDAFYDEVSWLVDAGIATGWSGNDGTSHYLPLNPVNRDAMAAFLYRFHQAGLV